MLNILKNLDWSILTDILISILPALICITIHECSHGYAALLLGDTTAKRMGRLSLNPIKHFDIWGFVMMAVLGFGWAKPVPVDMRNFKHPKEHMAATALAGPASNVLLAIIMVFLFGLLMEPLISTTIGYYVLLTIRRTAYLSVSLAVFNIIPVPPLDGSKIFFSVLPDRIYDKLMIYERYGMIILAVLLVTDVLSGPLSTMSTFLFEKLDIFAQWGAALGAKLF